MHIRASTGSVAPPVNTCKLDRHAKLSKYMRLQRPDGLRGDIIPHVPRSCRDWPEPEQSASHPVWRNPSEVFGS
jgi:hypothetical protein